MEMVTLFYELVSETEKILLEFESLIKGVLYLDEAPDDEQDDPNVITFKSKLVTLLSLGASGPWKTRHITEVPDPYKFLFKSESLENALESETTNESTTGDEVENETNKEEERDQDCHFCTGIFKDLKSYRDHVLECRTKDQGDKVLPINPEEDCSKCPKILKTATEYKNDLCLFTEDRTWNPRKCHYLTKEDSGKCLKSYCHQTLLSDHIRQAHELCRLSPKRLLHHMNSFHTRKSLKCNSKKHKMTAKRTSSDAASTSTSTSMLSSPEDLVCSECGKLFKEKRYLKLHVKKDHENLRYLCSICGKEYRSKFMLEKHNRIKHEEVKLTCEICGKQTFDLEGHKAYNHKPLPFICTICDKSYIGRTQLEDHYKTKHLNEKTQCPYCPSQLCSRTALAQHVKQFCPAKKTKKKFICPDCGTECGAEVTLKKHFRKSCKARKFV